MKLQVQDSVQAPSRINTTPENHPGKHQTKRQTENLQRKTGTIRLTQTLAQCLCRRKGSEKTEGNGLPRTQSREELVSCVHLRNAGIRASPVQR
jgi:hypothetical protein